jgi:hypothetical protein
MFPPQVEVSGTPTSCLAAALDLHRGGWPVLPLAGKVPNVGKGWPHWQSSTPRLRGHFHRHPDANIGIRTGDGLVVLDIDPRHGGDHQLAALQADHGPLPATPTVLTGGGGRHLYFRGPTDHRSYDLAPGLEIKATGRQVVAPPSIHPETGNPYRWLDGHHLDDLPLADLPACLEPPSTKPCAHRNAQGAIPIPTHTGPVRHLGTEVLNTGSKGGPESDSARVAALLGAIGREGAWAGGDTFRPIPCVLPGHDDQQPSAGLYRGASGAWRYRCHGCGQTMGLARLYASVTVGRVIADGDFNAPEAARWLQRAWHAAGVDRAPIASGDLPEGLTKAQRKVAEGFALLHGLRRHHGDTDAVPFTVAFAARWCAVAPKTAERALQRLRDVGWLRPVEKPQGVRCGLLYELGVPVRQEGNPFRWVAPWVMLEPGLGRGVGDAARDDGDPVLAQPVVPHPAHHVEVLRADVGIEVGQDRGVVGAERFAPRVGGALGVDADGPAGDAVDVGGVGGHRALSFSGSASIALDGRSGEAYARPPPSGAAWLSAGPAQIPVDRKAHLARMAGWPNLPTTPTMMRLLGMFRRARCPDRWARIWYHCEMDRPSIHLRLPRDLHDQLRETADDQELSLNSLLVALLAGSVGWKLDPGIDR